MSTKSKKSRSSSKRPREEEDEAKREQYLHQLQEEQQKKEADETENKQAYSDGMDEEPPAAQLPYEGSEFSQVLDVDAVLDTQEDEKKAQAALLELDGVRGEAPAPEDMPVALTNEELQALPDENENALMTQNPYYFAHTKVKQEMFVSYKYTRDVATVTCFRVKGPEDEYLLCRWTPLCVLRHPFLGPLGNWMGAAKNTGRKFLKAHLPEAEYQTQITEYGWNKKLLRPEDEDLDPELTNFFNDLEDVYHQAAVFIVRHQEVLSHKPKVLQECIGRATDLAQIKHQDKMKEKKRIKEKLKANPAYPLDEFDKELLEYPDQMGPVPEELIVDAIKSVGSNGIIYAGRTATNRPIRKINFHKKIFVLLSKKQQEAAEKEKKQREEQVGFGRRAQIPEAGGDNKSAFDRIVDTARDRFHMRYVSLKVENCDGHLVPRNIQNIPDGTVAWVNFSHNFYVETPTDKVHWGMRTEPQLVRVYRKGKSFQDTYQQIRAREPVFKKPKYAQDIFQKTELEALDNNEPEADEIDLDIIRNESGDMPVAIFSKPLTIRNE
jgi:hypothetical protein